MALDGSLISGRNYDGDPIHAQAVAWRSNPCGKERQEREVTEGGRDCLPWLRNMKSVEEGEEQGRRHVHFGLKFCIMESSGVLQRRSVIFPKSKIVMAFL